MTKQTSRRAVLAGVAAVPALSIPAIAADHPDAKLLTLVVRWFRAQLYKDKMDAVWDEAHEKVMAAAYADDPWPDQEHWTPKDAEKYFVTVQRHAVLAGEPYEKARKDLDAAWSHIDALVDEIVSIKPTTVEGFGVKAFVVTSLGGSLFEKKDDSDEYKAEDYGDDELRQLVRELSCAGDCFREMTTIVEGGLA